MPTRQGQFLLREPSCQRVAESYWWSREVRWRLSRVGLSHDRAHLVWEKAQPILASVLREEAEALRVHLDESLGSEVLVENCGDLKAQQYHLLGF